MSESVECVKCGRPFELVPRVMQVPKMCEDQPPTKPIVIKRTNPCLKVNGVYVDYCSTECFTARDEVSDCWACGMPNPSEFHVGREHEVLEGIRCPGCCGPVYRNNFCDKEESRRFVAYTCGIDNFKIGPHGSLAYIRPGDTRELQAALDEEFEKDQEAREDYKRRFLAGETLTRRSCWGGRSIAITDCPRGRRAATTHGVDCVCASKEATSDKPPW